MNKDELTKILQKKMEEAMLLQKQLIAKKVISEATELNEDHFSDEQLNDLLAKFEKDMNHEGIKAVEDYIDAEASGNKGKAAQCAAKIKRVQ